MPYLPKRWISQQQSVRKSNRRNGLLSTRCADGLDFLICCALALWRSALWRSALALWGGFALWVWRSGLSALSVWRSGLSGALLGALLCALALLSCALALCRIFLSLSLYGPSLPPSLPLCLLPSLCLPAEAALLSVLRALAASGLGRATVLARMSEMRIALPLSVAATMRWRNSVHPRKLLVSPGRAGIVGDVLARDS